MKLKTLIFGPLLFCLLWFIGWESFAVWDARNKTEVVFSPYRHKSELELTWSDIPERWQDMIIKVEDPKFFSHRGVDIMTPGAGITTITQGLAKRLYFKKFTPGFAKIEQSLIALFAIEPAISKETQLDAFVNVVHFAGDGPEPVLGFQNAARHYFGKRFLDLSEDQFLQLLAAVVGPYELRPGSPANTSRVLAIRKYLKGACAPRSNSDVFYEACLGV